MGDGGGGLGADLQSLRKLQSPLDLSVYLVTFIRKCSFSHGSPVALRFSAMPELREPSPSDVDSESRASGIKHRITRYQSASNKHGQYVELIEGVTRRVVGRGENQTMS